MNAFLFMLPSRYAEILSPNNTAKNTLKLIHLLVRINIDIYNRDNDHREARNNTFCY